MRKHFHGIKKKTKNERISKYIFSAKENKTVIFVSHNRNNLIFCDDIYEVKERTLTKSI